MLAWSNGMTPDFESVSEGSIPPVSLFKISPFGDSKLHSEGIFLYSYLNTRRREKRGLVLYM